MFELETTNIKKQIIQVSYTILVHLNLNSYGKL